MEQNGGNNKKKLYIVRHGETAWNIQKKLQGCEADIELNNNGRKQALITGKYLNDYQQTKTKFDIIYCSPQKRALETAKIIAKELSYDDEIIIIDDLKELCVGKLSGTTEQDRKTDPAFHELNELQNKYKNIIDPIDKMKKALYYENIISKTYDRETLDEIIIQVQKVLKKITENAYRKILVVTHGGLMNNMFMVIGNTYDYGDGDVTNGQNCKIGYVEYQNSTYKIFTNPNTVHFDLYKRIYH